MPFSDQTEYPRGVAYGANISATPLVVDASAALKISSIHLSNRNGAARTVLITEGSGAPLLFSIYLDFLSSIEIPCSWLAANGLRLTATGASVDATVFYVTN